MKNLLGDVMKAKLGQLQGGLTIKIEVEPAEKDAEDKELKKQGLAPSLPEKDQEVKTAGLQKEMAADDDDPSEMADHFLAPEEQDEMAMMAEQGQKPKGLQAKAEQLMAMKKVAKKKEGGKA